MEQGEYVLILRQVPMSWFSEMKQKAGLRTYKKANLILTLNENLLTTIKMMVCDTATNKFMKKIIHANFNFLI